MNADMAYTKAQLSGSLHHTLTHKHTHSNEQNLARTHTHTHTLDVRLTNYCTPHYEDGRGTWKRGVGVGVKGGVFPKQDMNLSSQERGESSMHGLLWTADRRFLCQLSESESVASTH